jgi:two-component system KDP operon response regulator KdpE
VGLRKNRLRMPEPHRPGFEVRGLMALGPAVLIIDDDPAIRRLLRRELSSGGYRVEDMEPGKALARVAERKFDLVILDTDAPVSSGPAIISAVRELSSIPILALSSRDDEHTAASALESGADDWIQKPFNTREILARIKNALRRRAREQGKPVHLASGALEIDLLHRRVRLSGQQVRLSVKRYEVLRVLAEGAGKVITHREILSAVWGRRRIDRVGYLRVAIRMLRRQLESDPAHPRYILTEPRVGYRLDIQACTERQHRRPDPKV